MREAPPLLLALAAGVVVLLVLVTAALVWHQAALRRRRWRARLDDVTAIYLPSRAPEAARRPLRSAAAVVSGQWHGVLGYRPGRAVHYSVSLRRVCLIALLPAALATLLLNRLIGTFAWAAAPAIWVVMLRYYHATVEHRLGGRLYKQFPDALSMIVRAVRVGVPVTEAVRLVSVECLVPTTIEFRQLSDEVAIGVPLDQALLAMSVRNRLPEYRFFATALSLQSQTGGGLTETLETLADTIRKRVAARARGHALASEARTSCYMLAVLPVIVGAGLYLTNPDYMSVLFTTHGGNLLLAGAAASLSVGLFAMRTIIRLSLT